MFEEFYEWVTRHGAAKLVLSYDGEARVYGFIVQDSKRVFEFSNEYELENFLREEVELPGEEDIENAE